MKTDADEMLADLATFQAVPKFQSAEPELRVLSRARVAIAGPLEAALDRCASDLASLVKSGASPAQLSMCIKTSLCSVEKPFNKKDREYLTNKNDQKGKRDNDDKGPLLNRWLYGYLLSTL